MISETFVISAHNVGHAAIAVASWSFPDDEPATIQLAPHAEPTGVTSSTSR